MQSQRDAEDNISLGTTVPVSLSPCEGSQTQVCTWIFAKSLGMFSLSMLVIVYLSHFIMSVVAP